MNQPGRKSAASLSVIPIGASVPRLSPPAHLNADARAAWNEVVAARPAEFFDRSSAALLESYAVATAEHRRLSKIIGTLDPIADADTFGKITRAMDTHALRIGAVATKLRLTNQSRFDAQRAGTLSRQTGTHASRILANYGGDGDAEG